MVSQTKPFVLLIKVLDNFDVSLGPLFGIYFQNRVVLILTINFGKHHIRSKTDWNTIRSLIFYRNIRLCKKYTKVTWDVGCVFSKTGQLWLIHNTGICIQFRITLRSMRSKCHGQRKSLAVQLNSRPVRRIELIRNSCTDCHWQCDQLTYLDT